MYWLVFDAVTEYLTGIREEGFILAQCTEKVRLVKFCGHFVVMAAGMWELIMLVLGSREDPVGPQDGCPPPPARLYSLKVPHSPKQCHHLG